METEKVPKAADSPVITLLRLPKIPLLSFPDSHFSRNWHERVHSTRRHVGLHFYQYVLYFYFIAL